MNWTIPVYEDEEKLGLTEAIQANRSIAYTTHVNNANKIQWAFKRSDKKFEPQELAVATNLNQLDLYYFAAILVTTTWNLNDDVFGLKEVWEARKTPEDKPINIEHRQEEIVGHITNSIAVNADTLEVIPDDTAIDLLPKKIHLITGGVLYQSWKNENHQERINEMIEKIEAKKEYVSMECLFRTFDYAVKRADGSTGTIIRNDETSFLTKHLRAYGGTGEYNGMKIGRFPKQLIFSGKGLTANPANQDERGPISIIFDAEKFDEMFVESTTAGVIPMEVKLEDQVKELTDKVSAMSSQLESAIADATAKETKLGELQAAVEAANKAVADANEAKAAVEKQLAEANEKYTELNVKFVKASRLTQLVTAGHSKESAEVLVEKFSSLNDETFSEVAKLAQPTVEKKAEASVEDDTDPDSVLDTASANKDAALNVGNNDAKASLTQEIISFLKVEKMEK